MILIRSTILLGLFFIHACTRPSASNSTSATSDAAKTKVEDVLKIGLLYTGDTFPIFQAHKLGMFDAAGVKVEIVDFMSALERDGALQAKAIDGSNNDLIGTSLLAKSGASVEVVKLILGNQKNVGRVAILTSLPEEIRTPADMKGREIAVSTGTVIDYLTDKMLAKVGLTASDVKKTPVTNIPVRMNLLVEKKMPLGVLPEPLASFVVQKGGKVLVDDSEDPYSHAVIVFRKEVVEQKREAVARFLEVYEKMATQINANRESFRQAIAERCRVPEAVQESFTILRYSTGDLPSQALFDDVQDWLVKTNLLTSKFAYNDLINKSFTPVLPQKNG